MQDNQPVAWKMGFSDSSWDKVTQHKTEAEYWSSTAGGLKISYPVRPLYAAPVTDKADALLIAAKQMVELVEEIGVENAIVLTPEIKKWLPGWKKAIQKHEAGQ